MQISAIIQYEIQFRRTYIMNNGMSKGWVEDESAKLLYPNKMIARIVWRNVLTGEKIVNRFNEAGDLIYTNRRSR